ncbi:putative pentatricopeptide repeat-containing protein, chloroplastic [Cocos nucifera]|nr:putative pentatricopeptide repeat-containing protein, chloroplastic [Cocos nucifera]
MSDRLLNKEEGLRSILQNDDIYGIEKLDAIGDLSMEMRVLHHIICTIFFLRADRFDFVSGRDLCMHHIVCEIPLNLPALMIDAMQEAVTRLKASLPYSMALTRIFRSFGIDFTGEVATHLAHTDTYNANSLHHMGYVRVGDRCTRGGRVAEEEEDRAEEDRLSSPPHDHRASPDI